MLKKLDFRYCALMILQYCLAIKLFHVFFSQSIRIFLRFLSTNVIFSWFFSDPIRFLVVFSQPIIFFQGFLSIKQIFPCFSISQSRLDGPYWILLPPLPTQ